MNIDAIKILIIIDKLNWNYFKVRAIKNFIKFYSNYNLIIYYNFFKIKIILKLFVLIIYIV